MGHVALLNKFDFDDICISVKCSDVPLTMAAYRLLSRAVRTTRCTWASPRRAPLPWGL